MSEPVNSSDDSLPDASSATARPASLLSGPDREVPPAASVFGAVLAHARRAPDAIALRADGPAVTYGGLVRHAHRVCADLRRAGVTPGTVVPIFAETGEAMIGAALGVLAVGAAFAAVDPRWPTDRVASIMEDCGSSVVLDTGSPPCPHPGVTVVPVSASPDEEDLRPPDLTKPEPGTSAAAAACVFFTSGSTGRPKGAVIPHRAFFRTFHHGGFAQLGPGTVFLHAAPPYWDAMALEIFGALMNGGCVVPAEGRLLDPGTLRGVVARRGVNTAWLTASLFNVLVDEGLDAFTGLRTLLIGGERLSVPHVSRFLSAHPDIHLINGYGPVESMVFTTTHRIVGEDVRRPDGIPLGRPVRNTTIWVCDETGRIVPRGEPGELVIAGDGLALGYLGNPGEQQHRFFETCLPDGTTGLAYRSGDHVRMDPDGLLHYLGRIDRQFKIRGYRVEPGEVEQVVKTWPGILASVLLPVRSGTEQTVSTTACAYTTASGSPVPESELARHARDTLPAHARPGGYIHLPEIPLGPTGKADLATLLALVRGPRARPEGQEALPAQAAELTTDGTVLAIARDVLGFPWLRADDNLFRVGADSLHVLRLAARLVPLAAGRLSPADVYRSPTVETIEELLRTRQAARCSWESMPASQEEPPVGRTALTAGQRRFWFAERLAPGSPAHVAVTRIRLNGALDRSRLDRALNDVVTRHPALRTVFPRPGVSPVPRLLAPGTPPVSWHSAGEISEGDLLSRLAAQVHDLERGPLVAVGGIQDGELEHRIVVCVHHIAYDAESERAFVQDLARYYAGRRLPPVKLQASERAVPQQDRERLREFWKARLDGAPVLHLPDSNPLPLRVAWTRKLVTARVDLSAADPVRLRSAAAELRAPVLAFFLTAWWRVLACHTDSTDHVIGTAVAATDDGECTIGYRANNIPVRVAMSAGQLAVQQLPVVRDHLLDALDHAGLPTDEIALLGPRPPAGRMPLYQSMVLLQSVTPPYKVGHVEFVPQPGFPLGPQCELLLEIWEADDGFTANLLSPEGFLPPSRIARLASDVSAEMIKTMAAIAPE